jgi:REP element-mobilizing transposase RayT
VVLRFRQEVWNLRSYRAFRRIHQAFEGGCARFGFRLVEFSIQGNHIHLIAEAENRRSLSRAMQGLAVRIARRLNGMMKRKGPVFRDRYFARTLRTPLAVRRALHYVLNNRRRHAYQEGKRLPERWVDPFSSGVHFDGWCLPLRAGLLARCDPRAGPGASTGTAQPRTQLLATAWRLLGPLDPAFIPGPRACIQTR